jgi:hypothetical protein
MAIVSLLGLALQLTAPQLPHSDAVRDSTHATRARVTAAAASTAPRIDGVLDDDIWRLAQPVSGFVQAEPDEGRPATEATEVRIAYDEGTLYVAAYMHDRTPGGIVVNDIRKDFREDDQDDFELLLDTFGDRRNGYVFITNAAGAKADRQIANEGRDVNTSWDAVWRVATKRVADGWIAEFAIPFRSLRFAAGAEQRWGINFSRRIRRRNEIDFWSPVPRAYNLARASLAGDLVGLDITTAPRDLRVKPYVTAGTVRDVGGSGYRSRRDVGGDVKYGVSRGLTLDVTVNPDFAQVEADEQQVNLTQFSQFFPEKREFFLENAGIFYVGDAARNNKVNTAPTPDEDLLLFFSRRIGLTAAGTAVPIPAGVRLSGTAAGTGIGALSMQTRGDSALGGQNFSVLRLRRNVGVGSDVGVLAMQRLSSTAGGDYNRIAAADATLRFFGVLDWSSYAVRSFAPGAARGQYAARTSLNYEGNFAHVKAGALEIGRGFRDDLGYMRRTDVRKWLLDAGIRPRLASLRAHGVREMHPHVTWNYYESPVNRLMTAKNLHTGYTFFFTNGAFAELSANPRFERLTAPFVVDRTVPQLPVGGYGWNEWQLKGTSDLSRPLAVDVTLIGGGLWNGTQRTIRMTTTMRPTSRLSVAAGITRTAAELFSAVPAVGLPGAAEGVAASHRFVASRLTARTNYSFSTAAFIDGLAQYDPRSHQLSTNLRFNVIHHPLSDLYVVYNEQRFSTVDAPVLGRSLTVKVTQMLGF